MPAGRVNEIVVTVGTVATISCQVFYVLSPAMRGGNLTCVPDSASTRFGKYVMPDGTDATLDNQPCIPVTCEFPPENNGRFEDFGTVDGQAIWKLTCNPGYAPNRTLGPFMVCSAAGETKLAPGGCVQSNGCNGTQLEYIGEAEPSNCSDRMPDRGRCTATCEVGTSASAWTCMDGEMLGSSYCIRKSGMTTSWFDIVDSTLNIQAAVTKALNTDYQRFESKILKGFRKAFAIDMGVARDIRIQLVSTTWQAPTTTTTTVVPHYVQAAGFEDGQYCGGEMGVDRKTIGDDAKQTTEQCADAVKADNQCSNIFTYGTDRNGGPGVCTCVLQGKSCKAENPTDEDTYDHTIYELQAIDSTEASDGTTPQEGRNSSRNNSRLLTDEQLEVIDSTKNAATIPSQHMQVRCIITVKEELDAQEVLKSVASLSYEESTAHQLLFSGLATGAPPSIVIRGVEFASAPQVYQMELLTTDGAPVPMSDMIEMLKERDPPPTLEKKEEGLSIGVILGIVGGVVGFLLLLCCLVYRKRIAKAISEEEEREKQKVLAELHYLEHGMEEELKNFPAKVKRCCARLHHWGKYKCIPFFTAFWTYG